MIIVVSFATMEEARFSFAPNLSLLFGELPFLERFQAAADAGFGAVEFWWPPEDPDLVTRAVGRAGVTVAVLNFFAGDMPAGDRGLLSDPDRQHEFRANVPIALELARGIGCRRLNALVGLESSPGARAEQLALARDNVRWAADLAVDQGAEVLIEAVNTFENGPYLLATTAAARAFVAEVDRPNVRLQYDAYHMQRMEGNVVDTLRRHLPEIAHVQIADSPGRNEPGTGELDYDLILAELSRLGYDGYVGLEYRPSGATLESFGWLFRHRGGLGYQEGS